MQNPTEVIEFASYIKSQNLQHHICKEKTKQCDITSSLSTMPVSTAHSSTLSQLNKDFSDRSLQINIQLPQLTVLI